MKSWKRVIKRPQREDIDVDQKLERLKEQLMMELGFKDNNGPPVANLLTICEVNPARDDTKKVHYANPRSL